MVPKASHAHTQSHGHGGVLGHRVRPRSRSGSLSIARSPSVLSAGTVFPPPIISPADLEQGSAPHVSPAGSGPNAISSGANASVGGGTNTGAGTGGGAGGAGYVLRRVVSNHTRLPSAFAPLGSIESTDDLASLTTKTSKDDFDIEHRAELERRHGHDDHNHSHSNGYDYEYDVQPMPLRFKHDEPTDGKAEIPSYTIDPHGPYEDGASTSAEYIPSRKSSLLDLPTKSQSISDSDENDEERGGRGGGGGQGYDGPFQPPDSRELFGILASVSAVCVLAVAAGMTTIFDWVL